MSTERTHQDNVARGLKAAINNPNVSAEAKAHDRERLREMGEPVPKDRANVVRGLKAAVHNPNVSEEAKERDRQRLREMGESFDDSTASGPRTRSQEAEEHEHRVLGGYKATLSNPNAGPDAKAHAEDVLKAAGEL